MKLPVDKETMQRFPGISQKIQPRTDLTDPLCQLCRLLAEFHPTKEVKEAFHQIQQELSKNIQLSYFDSNSDTTPQTDSSTRGPGAVILQHGNPIYFPSRVLSHAKKNYQNVERESLGTIWGRNDSITFSMENHSSWKQIRNHWFLSTENTGLIFQ